MNGDETKRGGLGRFVRAGRQQAQRLKRGEALAAANSTTSIEDVQKRLDEARTHQRRDTVQDREWVLTIVRGVLGTLDELEDDRVASLIAAANAIGAEVVAREEQIFAPMREALRDGRYTVDRWRADVADLVPLERDAFTSRLLGLYNPPRATHQREHDMVHFVASTTDQIVEAAQFLGPDDVVYDIGCGTGKVAFLLRWLTGATVRGVEYDPVYVERANAVKESIGIDVDFIVGDARDLDYDDATVLYLFEPFRGEVMRSFLARVEPLRHTREVRLLWRYVVADGFAGVPWLERIAVEALGLHRYRTLQQGADEVSPAP